MYHCWLVIQCWFCTHEHKYVCFSVYKHDDCGKLHDYYTYIHTFNMQSIYHWRYIHFNIQLTKTTWIYIILSKNNVRAQQTVSGHTVTSDTHIKHLWEIHISVYLHWWPINKIMKYTVDLFSIIITACQFVYCKKKKKRLKYIFELRLLVSSSDTKWCQIATSNNFLKNIRNN